MMEHKRPISTINDWEAMYDLLWNEEQFAPLFDAELSKTELILYLTPAANIAKWIDSHPHIANQESLHITVAGAYLGDSPDNGHWYAFIPWLLGRDDETVRVDLVNPEFGKPVPELDGETVAYTPLRESISECLKNISRTFPQTLGEYLDTSQNLEDIDLVCIPQPGMMTLFPEWLIKDDGLRRVVESGTANFQGHYSYEDYCVDKLVFEEMGFSGIDDFSPSVLPDSISYKFNGGDRGIGQFAGWASLPANWPKSIPKKIHNNRIMAVFEHHAIVADPDRIGIHYYFDTLLNRAVDDGEGDPLSLIGLLHNCCANAETGEILLFDHQTQSVSPTGQVIDKDRLAKCPAADDDLYNKLLWACDVAADYKTAHPFQNPDENPFADIHTQDLSPEEMMEIFEEKVELAILNDPSVEPGMKNLLANFKRDMARYM